MPAVALAIYDGRTRTPYKYPAGLQKMRDMWTEYKASGIPRPADEAGGEIRPFAANDYRNYFLVKLRMEVDGERYDSPWFCIRRYDLYIVGFASVSTFREGDALSVYYLTQAQTTYDSRAACVSVRGLAYALADVTSTLNLTVGEPVARTRANCLRLENYQIKPAIFWLCEASKLEVAEANCMYLKVNEELDRTRYSPADWHTWAPVIKDFNALLEILPMELRILPVKPLVTWAYRVLTEEPVPAATNVTMLDTAVASITSNFFGNRDYMGSAHDVDISEVDRMLTASALGEATPPWADHPAPAYLAGIESIHSPTTIMLATALFKIAGQEFEREMPATEAEQIKALLTAVEASAARLAPTAPFGAVAMGGAASASSDTSGPRRP